MPLCFILSPLTLSVAGYEFVSLDCAVCGAVSLTMCVAVAVRTPGRVSDRLEGAVQQGTCERG